MKTIFFFIAVSLSGALNRVSSQTVPLQSIQEEIAKAFYASFADGNSTQLTVIADRLKPDSSSLALYWIAYAKYYESLFYLKTEHREKSAAAIHEGLEVLSKLKSKNSEDYALLALMHNLSMKFTTDGMKFWELTGIINQNIEMAIQLDSNNLRAYYVAASNDFYTPEQFGGGKKAEEYLLKAIMLDAQTNHDSALPSWGKDQSYQMLINVYLKNGNTASAKQYLKEAQTLFPDKDWQNIFKIFD